MSDAEDAYLAAELHPPWAMLPTSHRVMFRCGYDYGVRAGKVAAAVAQDATNRARNLQEAVEREADALRGRLAAVERERDEAVAREAALRDAAAHVWNVAERDFKDAPYSVGSDALEALEAALRDPSPAVARVQAVVEAAREAAQPSHQRAAEPRAEGERPTIVCLCGSTRFIDAFHAANRRESLAGRIVLTVEIARSEDDAEHNATDPERKRFLDELHLRKIDLADEILVLNVGGYVGASTRREWQYAIRSGKRVRWLEPGNALEDADMASGDGGA